MCSSCCELLVLPEACCSVVCLLLYYFIIFLLSAFISIFHPCPLFLTKVFLYKIPEHNWIPSVNIRIALKWISKLFLVIYVSRNIYFRILFQFIKPPPAVEIKEITEPEQKEETSEFNVSNESDELLQANDNIYNIECFLQRANIFSPTVHWRQSTNYVWIKILLPDVKSFKMEWTTCYINFQ